MQTGEKWPYPKRGQRGHPRNNERLKVYVFQFIIGFCGINVLMLRLLMFTLSTKPLQYSGCSRIEATLGSSI